jgi:hypothetical protein
LWYSRALEPQRRDHPLAGVIANMHIYFQPTSLFNTLVMLILFVGRLGLMARALRPYRGQNVE